MKSSKKPGFFSGLIRDKQAEYKLAARHLQLATMTQ